MDLFLVRHAEAEPGRPGLDDERRALTLAGVERFVAGVAGLARLRVRFDRIYHSPLLRALETAELLMPLLDADGETIVTPHLAAPPSGALIAQLTGESTALVGHQPWLSELLGTLVLGWEVIGGDRHEPFEIDKGGIAWLQGDPRPGTMTLRALWTPKTLRKLGR